MLSNPHIYPSTHQSIPYLRPAPCYSYTRLGLLAAPLLNTIKQPDNISDKDKRIRFNQTDQVDCQRQSFSKNHQYVHGCTWVTESASEFSMPIYMGTEDYMYCSLLGQILWWPCPFRYIYVVGVTIHSLRVFHSMGTPLLIFPKSWILYIYH